MVIVLSLDSMYKKTTITQAGLDAMEGKNDEMN